jgi:hypothetical protein
MDPVVVQYLGFVVAALILIWAVIEMSRRYSRRKKAGAEALTTWVPMDTTRFTGVEELQPGEGSNTPGKNPSHSSPEGEWSGEDQDNAPEQNPHTRARQNGHYSKSKKSL